jgi:RimJ/RimL family protein N-acetyltransferase
MAFSIPTLETSRLTLRAFRQSDFEAYAAMCADAEVMRFLGGVMTRADAWRHMAMLLGHWQLRGYGLWAVEEKATRQFVGRVGLLNPEGWPDLEVAWTLVRARWHQGFATEAALASVDYAFSAVGTGKVISMISPDNHPSIRVAERIGERFEREVHFIGHRTSIYGLTKA